MKSIFEKAKKYYETGRWTKAYLQALVEAGRLTVEEYELITGEPYGEG